MKLVFTRVVVQSTFSVVALVLIQQTIFASSTPVASSSQSKDSLPFTALVINNENKQIFVYPAQAAKEYQQDSGNNINQPLTAGKFSAVQFSPIPDLPKHLATETEINSLGAPLAQRAAIYIQTIIRSLTGGAGLLSLVSTASWSQTVLGVVERFAFLDLQHFSQRPTPSLAPVAVANGTTASKQTENGSTQTALPGSAESAVSQQKKVRNFWPFQTPLSLSTLAQMNGILAVVVARNDSPAGVVEQIDLIAFESGQMTRTYWSRSMHDPTLFKPTNNALSQVASKFVARLKQTRSTLRPKEDANTITLKFSRTVPQFRIPQIQNISEKLAPGHKNPLVAREIDRDFITFTTHVPAAKIGEFKAAIKRDLPELELRAAPAAEKSEGSAAKLVFELHPLKNPNVQNNEKKIDVKKKVDPTER